MPYGLRATPARTERFFLDVMNSAQIQEVGMRIHLFVSMLLTAACLAGCNSDDGISGRVGYGVTYHNTNVQFQYGDLTIPAADLPPAKTNRNGDFMVANVSQVISTPQ